MEGESAFRYLMRFAVAIGSPSDESVRCAGPVASHNGVPRHLNGPHGRGYKAHI